MTGLSLAGHPVSHLRAILTLEDETGMINVVITPDRFERDALLISSSPLLLIRGVLPVEQHVVNVRAKRFKALTLARRRVDASPAIAAGLNVPL